MPVSNKFTFTSLRKDNWECLSEKPNIPAKDILVSKNIGRKLRSIFKNYATKVAHTYNEIDNGGLSFDETLGQSWMFENTKPSTFKAIPQKFDKDFKKGELDNAPYLNYHAYIGKYKGELPKATAQFYYCLVNLGVFFNNATSFNIFQFPILEVTTPYSKGLEYFLKVVEENITKINLKTAIKPTIINEFPRKDKRKDEVTSSAEIHSFSYKGKSITASTKEEAIQQIVASSKATSKFRPREVDALNECLKLLEKQTEICGKRLYFSLDEEKEVVNVYLDANKKDVYLTINVGSDSTATAMYDIWDRIHSKI